MLKAHRFGLTAVVLAVLLGAASAARADDLAERRALAETLVRVVPYSDQDATRDISKGVVNGVRQSLGDKLTPYAESEMQTAIRLSTPRFPSFNEQVTTRLAEGMTVDELREAIKFLKSPLAGKLRSNQAALDAETDNTRKLALINTLFTPAELIELSEIVSSPGTRKYMGLLSKTGSEIGQDMAKIYIENLEKRCVGRTAPLPWCN